MDSEGAKLSQCVVKKARHGYGTGSEVVDTDRPKVKAGFAAADIDHPKLNSGTVPERGNVVLEAENKMQRPEIIDLDLYEDKEPEPPIDFVSQFLEIDDELAILEVVQNGENYEKKSQVPFRSKSGEPLQTGQNWIPKAAHTVEKPGLMGSRVSTVHASKSGLDLQEEVKREIVEKITEQSEGNGPPSDPLAFRKHQGNKSVVAECAERQTQNQGERSDKQRNASVVAACAERQIQSHGERSDEHANPGCEHAVQTGRNGNSPTFDPRASDRHPEHISRVLEPIEDAEHPSQSLHPIGSLRQASQQPGQLEIRASGEHDERFRHGSGNSEPQRVATRPLTGNGCVGAPRWFSQPVRVLAVQCARCLKWRQVPTREKYEAIRERYLETPWYCERAVEWTSDAHCDLPADLIQDLDEGSASLWTFDKPNLPSSPPGWQRRVVVRTDCSTKFADVYYTTPDRKTLRSMVEVEKYMRENPGSVPSGTTIRQFSFTPPRPWPGLWTAPSRKRSARGTFRP